MGALAQPLASRPRVLGVTRCPDVRKRAELAHAEGGPHARLTPIAPVLPLGAPGPPDGAGGAGRGPAVVARRPAGAGRAAGPATYRGLPDHRAPRPDRDAPRHARRQDARPPEGRNC